MRCSILEFGAVGDGKTLNTAAIQSAIDAVSREGGGTVVVPSGVYLTGTLRLADDLELHLEHGAVLLGSEDLSHYNDFEEYPQNFQSEREGWTGKHLILAVEKKNVALTGSGTICGNGKAFFGEPHRCKSFNYFWCKGIAKAKDPVLLRPGHMIALVECEGVRVTDLTLTDSPCWTLLLHGCQNALIHGLTISNPPDHANTDGIDLDCCRGVTVSACRIDTGDDAIAIRCSGARLLHRESVCEQITVSGCVLASSGCGIRIGVGRGQIRSVVCTGLTICRAGSALELMTAYRKNGDANLSDLMFENISAVDVSYPFRLLQWNQSMIRGVRIAGYRAKCYCGAIMEAEENGLISDILIRDFSMEAVPAPFLLDERAPAERGEYLLTAKGVNGLWLDHVRLSAREECERDFKGRASFLASECISRSECNF